MDESSEPASDAQAEPERAPGGRAWSWPAVLELAIVVLVVASTVAMTVKFALEIPWR